MRGTAWIFRLPSGSSNLPLAFWSRLIHSPLAERGEDVWDLNLLPSFDFGQLVVEGCRGAAESYGIAVRQTRRGAACARGQQNQPPIFNLNAKYHATDLRERHFEGKQLFLLIIFDCFGEIGS